MTTSDAHGRETTRSRLQVWRETVEWRVGAVVFAGASVLALAVQLVILPHVVPAVVAPVPLALIPLNAALHALAAVVLLRIIHTFIVTDAEDSAALVGDTGRVVPPRAPEALASALAALLALGPEGRRALGQKARQRIVENYPLGAMIGRTASLYSALLSGGDEGTGDRCSGQGGRRHGTSRSGTTPWVTGSEVTRPIHVHAVEDRRASLSAGGRLR